MVRTEDMVQYLNSYENSWIEEIIKRIRGWKEESLYNAVQNLLLLIEDRQQKEYQKNIAFLSLFYFRSSVWTGSHRYQIWATNSTLYYDIDKICMDWVPEGVQNDVQYLRGEVESVLLKKYIRLTPFEIDSCVRKIMIDYQKIIEVYWYNVSERIIKSNEFLKVKKDEDWKILFGNYMDEVKVVFAGRKD